jgi:hypothetical protein
MVQEWESGRERWVGRFWEQQMVDEVGIVDGAFCIKRSGRQGVERGAGGELLILVDRL